MITGDEISVIRKEAEAASAMANNTNAADEDDNEDEENENDEDEDDVFGDDEDEDDSNPKLDKIVAVSAIIAAVIVLIIGILIVVTAVKGCGGDDNTPANEEQTTDGKTTKVPAVIGKTEEEAQQMLKDADLGYRIVRESHNTIEKGHVIKLSEDVGSVVAKQSTITVTVSLGAEAFDIPTVVGMDKTKAKELLESEKYGLKVEIEWEASEDVKEDTVMDTNPKAPTQLKYGDKITLTVSLGKDTSDVEVPSLKNKTEAQAKESLEEKGLVLVVKDRKNSDSVSAGKIISQEISSGTTVPRGTEINVVMSLGPQQTTTSEPETTTNTVVNEYTVLFTTFTIGDDVLPYEDEEGNPIAYNFEATVSYASSDGGTLTYPVTDQLQLTHDGDKWKQPSQISIKKSNATHGTEAVLTITANGTVVATHTAVFQ